MSAPLVTYRLQLNSELGFTAAAALAPYFARLGITHVYTSPILKARPGSTHGYDIVAHDALNPELGLAAQFDAMVAAFAGAGLKVLLDFVPNHMGVSGADNPLWLDVLEWGPESAYAGWFDIDWEPHRGYLHDKLLVPVLGDQYGIELDAGKLELKLDEAAGELAVWAYDHHKLPLCPLTYGDVLGSRHPTLERLGDEFGALTQWKPQVGRRAGDLKRELAAAARSEPGVREALGDAVRRVNKPDDDGVRRALDAVIAKQYWRAAHFRVAGDDINYRRFFNINDLAGLRIELPEVFEHVHALVLVLLGDRVVDGLRIDHIDGLLDPTAYLARLRSALTRVGVPDCYVVVEKILARGEVLPPSWPVDGTTGYEFAAAALQVLLDPAGEAPLTRLYRELTDEREPFADVVHEAKLKIMRNDMASEVNVLARDAARVARQNPRTADFTHGLLRAALREVIASFPVYRTYVDAAGRCTETDLKYLGEALAAARRRAPDLDSSVFAFLERLLSGKLVEAPRSGFSRVAALRCALKFQQLSGPIMAKGLEDTAFYRYNRFIALNEVGSDPRRVGSSAQEFHALNAARAKHSPRALSATATHDTKRGEDARARLAVLTELPDEWAEQVREWRRLLRGDEPAEAPPDVNDEYYFYQSLLGAWPPELCDSRELDRRALAELRDRLHGAMRKAVREAKRRSSWAAPDEHYESALLRLVDAALEPRRGNEFLARFAPFASRVARLGVHVSLAQLALKQTAPGVPDIYQGCELWDFSLVDPDNRRPVDFARRAALLDAVDEELARDRTRAFTEWLRSWHDGRVKLAATRTLNALRSRERELFAEGEYAACDVTGPRADEIVAFVRRRERRVVVTAVRRFPARAERSRDWNGTRIRLPREAEGAVDVFTHRTAHGAAIDAEALFATLPIAVLAPPNADGEA
ncbi:MAG TPA: malto-oligosyltrehalose synthase [Gammaproteobacteria bacterium]